MPKFLRTKDEIFIDYLEDLVENGVIQKDQFENYRTTGKKEILDLLDKKIHETEDYYGARISTLDSFYHFCNYLVKKDVATNRKVWNSLVKKFFLAVERNQYTCFMCARGHGKSYFWCLYTLFKAYTNPFFECIIASNTPKMGKRLFRVLNRLIDSNELLFERRNPDNKQDIPNTQFEMEYNHGYFEVTSVGTTPRSAHVSLAIVDDPLRDDKRYSDDFIENYVFGQIYPIVQRKKGRLAISGTPMHHKDLFHNVMRGSDGKLITDGRISDGEHKGFWCKMFPAILDELKKVTLLPETFSYDDLIRIKETQGDLFFTREYMLKCIDDKKALFPFSLLKSCTDESENYLFSGEENKNYVIGVDVATSGAASADYTAAIVLEVRERKRKIKVQEEGEDGEIVVKQIDSDSFISEKVVRHIFHEKGVDISRQIEIIQDLAIRFNDALVLVERNNVGVALIQELQQRNVNVESFTTDKFKKESAIRFLINEMQNGRIVFTSDDTYEVKKLKEELRNFGIKESRGKERMESLSGHDDLCCHPDTRVYVGNGIYKKIKDIKIGDYVMTNKGRLKRVNNIFKRNYSGKLKKINAYGSLPVIVTPNHPIMTFDTINYQKRKIWKKSELLKPGDELSFHYDFYNKFKHLDINESKLIGIFLAEGCASTKNKITFSFNLKEKSLANNINDLIKYKFGFYMNTEINEKRNSLVLSKKNKMLFDYFNKFYDINRNKYIPKDIFRLNIPIILVYYYLLGDGCFYKGSYSASSISYTLIQQIRLLLMRKGITSSIGYAKEQNKLWNNNKYYLSKEHFIINLSKTSTKKLFNLLNLNYAYKFKCDREVIKLKRNSLRLKVVNIEDFDYTGDVYNLEVDKYNNYIIENITVHNCSALWLANSATQNYTSSLAFAVVQD